MAANTKLKILKAAQRVIAEKGVMATSHRAIAAKAGVRLSMTSYHLGTMDEILETCFDDYEERAWRHITRLGENVTSKIAERGDRLTDPAVLDALRDDIIALLVQYLYDEVVDRNLDLALECNFLYSYHLPERLRSKVEEFDNRMLGLVVDVLRRLGSTSPDLDGNILLKMIRQIEFDHLTSRRLPDVEALTALLQRVMQGLFAGLPHSGEPK